MENIKENIIGQSESMDRQSMLNAIKEKIYPKQEDDSSDYQTGYGSYKQSPISLSRVLSVLVDRFYFYFDGFIYRGYFVSEYDISLIDTPIPRKLLTDSGSDAILDDQSDETIKSIRELLSEK